MLQRAASNGREISREDFYNIMTKKSFWLAISILLIKQANLYQLDCQTQSRANVWVKSHSITVGCSLVNIEPFPDKAKLFITIFLQLHSFSLALLPQILYSLLQNRIEFFKFLGGFAALEVYGGLSWHFISFFLVFLLQIIRIDWL